MPSHLPPPGPGPSASGPQPTGDPTHEHLFQPGHAASARRSLERGWPETYVAVCVLCGRAFDLLARPDGGTSGGHERA